MCVSSVISTGIVSLTYCSKLINEENWLKQFIPFHYDPLCLYLFSWLTLLIITVWHIGPTVNSCDWVHALLTGGGWFATVAQMPCQPIIRQGRGPGEARASFFFTCKCCNVIINTWHGAWLNYPPCLIKGATYCSSQPSVASLFLSPSSFCNISSPSLSFPILSSFLTSYFCLHPFWFSFFLSPHFPSFLHIHFLACWAFSLPFSPSLFYHSAVFTVIHYHFFCQLALTLLSFVRSHWPRPLGDKEMTEGGLYLPLWPLPCRLLNHVANRQHCLPARPHQDNGEPHSYLIQWSV